MANWQLIFFHPYSYIFYSLLALFSLAVGSFLNVVIFRLPQMMYEQWKQECQLLVKGSPLPLSSSVNLFFPRSFCPACHKTIKAIHNIPVLSWLLLKRKCAYCDHKIPARYPLIELMCCFLSLFAAWHFGPSLTLCFSLLFIWITLCLLFIDLDHQLLPDSLTLTLLWLGLLANTMSLFTSLPDAVLSACIAYLFLWLLIKIFYFITGKIGMGNGDFKLLAAFGAWFGWLQLPLILLLASFSGAIIGIIYLNRSKQHKDTPIPFGPFLCISGLIALFWGKSILNWYLHSFSF